MEKPQPSKQALKAKFFKVHHQRAVFTINTPTLHGCAQSYSDNIYIYPLIARLQVIRVLERKK